MGYVLTSFLLVYSLWQLIIIFQRVYSIIELASIKRAEEEKLVNGVLVISHIEYLSRNEFCEWCRIFLLKTGYESAETVKEKENSVDITCLINGRKAYAVCTNKGVGSQEYIVINKLIGAMASENIGQGIIITTGFIQASTFEYIQKFHPDYNIRIIDKDILEQECNSLCKNGILLYPEHEPANN